MKALPFSRVRFYIIFLALLILAGGLGYRLGERKPIKDVRPASGQVVNRESPEGTANIDFSLFWDVWQRLYRDFIDADKLDQQKMVWGAISGMVASAGDPYTVFLPPKENKEFKEELGGHFEGIGAQLGIKETRIIVVAPLRGMPAEKAGIRAGDWIMKVNDEESAGWTVPQAVAKIRGARGTTVKLSILHEGDVKPIEISIVRDTITVPATEVWIKRPAEIREVSGLAEFERFSEKNALVGYLRLSRFGDRMYDEWGKAVTEIVTGTTKKNFRGLILDLRNNPGGYLDGSVYIASEFLKSGVVVSQVNSDGTKQSYAVNRKGRLLNTRMVVLTNKGSASASEIVAGALSDHGRATLVGETTYGKGSVQTPQDLAGGAGLHITTGKWFTPKEHSISAKGITPDIEIKQDDVEATRDAQLAKAIEILLK